MRGKGSQLIGGFLSAQPAIFKTQSRQDPLPETGWLLCAKSVCFPFIDSLQPGRPVFLAVAAIGRLNRMIGFISGFLHRER